MVQPAWWQRQCISRVEPSGAECSTDTVGGREEGGTSQSSIIHSLSLLTAALSLTTSSDGELRQQEQTLDRGHDLPPGQDSAGPGQHPGLV